MNSATTATTTATETLSLGSLDVSDGLHLIAIHEAGHALLGWLHRQELDFITAKGGEGFAGLTRFAPVPIATWTLDLILAAGPAASATAQMIAPPSDDNLLGMPEGEVWEYFVAGAVLGGGGDDLQRSCEMHQGSEEPFDAAMEVTRRALIRFWPQLIALAEALVSHPQMTLTGDEAFAVLRDSLPTDHFMRDRSADGAARGVCPTGDRPPDNKGPSAPARRR